MPYINKERREGFDVLDRVESIRTTGELNYALTRLCFLYLEDCGALKGEVISYKHFNEVIGALECAKQEFYRRLVVPYEDDKRLQNGDVY